MTVCASWSVTHGPRFDGQHARNSPILWNRVQADKGGPAAGLRVEFAWDVSQFGQFGVCVSQGRPVPRACGMIR